MVTRKIIIVWYSSLLIELFVWAAYQIRKIAFVDAPGMAEMLPPPPISKETAS